ncbi:hypothetical protein GF312_15415 [Candidatus Poribacteria bacterium]|nr:hypothetical protein [Candidatus Poribacteria bacterium]
MARRTINIILTSIILIFALGLLIALEAQTSDKTKKRQPEPIDINISKEDMPRLVEIIRIWKMVDELDLEEDQLTFFLPRFKKYDKLISNYYRNRHNYIKDTKVLLESNATDIQLEEMIAKYRESEMDFFKEYRELSDELYSKLTVEQRAKFIVFQDEYRRDMRRLLKNLQDLNNLREQRMKHQPQTLEKK